MTIAPPTFTEEAPPDRAVDPDRVVDDDRARAAGRQLRSVIRTIRVDLQDLRLSLTRIGEAVDVPGVAPSQVAEVIAAEEPFRRKNEDQVAQNLQRASALLEEYLAHPRASGEISDDVAQLDNAWQRAVANWPSLPAARAELDPVAARRSVATVGNHLDEMIFLAARLTIPRRLVDSLERLRVGGRLDFHQSFADELPSRADRDRLLQYLARYPASYDAMIDVDTGMLHRIGSTARRRWASYALLGLAILGGAALIGLLTIVGQAQPLEGWRFTADRLAGHLGAYGAVIVGAVAHIGVDAIKEFRSSRGASRLLALEDMFLWGHVHEVTILVSVVSLWVVTLGLVAFLDTVPIYTAFLAGYSADSVLDIFLARFSQGWDKGAGAVTAAARPDGG